MTIDKNNKAPDPQPAERANASVVEQIAQQWDGCQYDAPGEMVDIGAAIRRAGKRLSAEVAEQQGAECGYVIADGTGEKFMAWGQVGPEWVADRSAALWLVRRADAEALAAENEDAWLILPVERCALPPAGWSCTLMAGHAGPCPTLAATGKQQVGEVEWVRDVHDVEQGLIQRPTAPHAANNAPSPSIRMQVGEVQGDARAPAEIAAVLRAMAINYAHGHVWDHLDAEVCREAADALAARQPGAQGQPSFGQVREIRIPARNNLDPISVFVQDQAAGRGRIVVTCYGNAWQAFWGAMGNRTVMEFVAQCDADYVAGNMISGRQTRMTKAERAYTERIATEVIAEFRALRDGQRDAAPGPRISQGTHDPSGVSNG